MDTFTLCLLQKHKRALIIYYSATVLVLIVGCVLASRIPYKKFSESPPENCYNDIIREKNYFSCWETAVFATNNDPFFRWAMDNSLTGAFEEEDKGAIGYQRASIWRVTGPIDARTNRSNLYSSPDPHLVGDEFLKYSKTFVGKMVVRWGISIRLCLIGRELTDLDIDSCLFTTPIVRVLNETGNYTYAALLVGVPFRKASEDPLAAKSSSDLYLDRRALYLTNVLSSARTKVGLKLRKDNRDYIYDGKECSRTSPIMFSLDVNVYSGYPSLQCACHGKICVTGVNLTGLLANDSFRFPFQLNADGCYTGKSFWDYDKFENVDSEGNYTAVLHTYSQKKDVYISLEATLEANEGLENFTSCVEDFVENDSLPDEHTLAQTLFTKCSNSMVLNVSAVQGFQSFDRYKNREDLTSLGRIFYDKVEKEEKQENVMCGFDEGQSKLTKNLCWVRLTDLNSATGIEQLQKRLSLYAEVGDVKKLASKQWNDKSAERVSIFNGIAATVVSLVLALLICNSDVYGRERQINKSIGWAPPLSWNVGTRVLGLSGVFIWSLYTMWLSLKGMEINPDIAMSNSFLQRLNSTQFVVTVTSTIQVIPDWEILARMSLTALVLVLIAIPCIWARISYLEEQLLKKDMVPGEQSNTILNNPIMNNSIMNYRPL